MGVRLGQCQGNSVCHTVGTAKHLMIPKSNDAIAFTFDDCGPLRVRPGAMLAAVDFDDQASPMACEVDDIMPDRSLPSKPRLQKILPQQAP